MIAKEAEKIVHGRSKSYGAPDENMKRTAALWSAYLGVSVTPADVAMCMVLVKVARESKTHKRDNLVDGIGYLIVADECNGRK